LAPSQWNPNLDELAQRFCIIKLGGAELGFVAPLEDRGHSNGYLRVIRNLVDELQIEPGHSVLDVGCGSGVLARWLAKETRGANRVTGVDINPYLLEEAVSLAKGEGLEHLIEFHEGSAEALPLPDDGFDATLSVTVLEEGNADLMLEEIVRVTQPGGRVAAMVRAIDVPFVVNVVLPEELKSKLEDAGGGVEPEGCADGSIYLRVKKAGLTNIKMFPQLATFESPFGSMGQFLQNRVLRNLSPEEQKAWRVAESRAAAEGTLFFAWPHHCVVGTKP
jgi:ubiquinone/menaquinone biosynthesis C-methylase UbiE